MNDFENNVERALTPEAVVDQARRLEWNVQKEEGKETFKVVSKISGVTVLAGVTEQEAQVAAIIHDTDIKASFLMGMLAADLP